MPDPKIYPKISSSRAFSLIEMVIAMVILAIVMTTVISLVINTNKAVETQQTNLLLDKEVESFFRRFDTRLSSSFGWIRGTPTSLTLINQDGDSCFVLWNPIDSMLYIDNSAQFPAGVKAASFTCFYMPQKAGEVKIEREFWLKEVDHDENGAIEGTELQDVSMLFVKIAVVKRKSFSENGKYCYLPPAIVETIIGPQNE